jgi:alpha-amylase
MAASVRLVLTFHNHQPIGNFDGVFEQAYQDSYLPFLDVMQDYPEISFGLHTSGSLLEWLEQNHPEYIERLRGMVASSQVEIIGGAFYEPILANIPRRDRIGQIRTYTRHLNHLFQTRVRGMWLPERVWEQAFASDISAAGIEYTIIDDYHFRCAGIPQNELAGYYVTEDEGRVLFVFPDSERLRYLIPFSKPQECIDYLKEVASEHDNAVMLFGDDGEKFGSWPETWKHVYEDGWLRQFLDLLRENASWLKVSTPSGVVDSVAPIGRCYLPDASYREMTEWVLPPVAQKEFVSLTRMKADDPDWQRLVRFTRGGFWRNFRTRYPESHEMYSRMIELSNRLAAVQAQQTQTLDQGQRDLLEDARTHLYRGQCNCAYWHGAFGGLYLPHLRNAIYAELIEADTTLERFTRGSSAWVDVAAADFNLDARQEVKLFNHRMIAWLSPAMGGHLYELDVRANGVNLLATLNRRPEPYHQRILDFGQNVQSADDADLASISKDVKFKQPDLDKKIIYDNWPRKSLVDHFLQPQLSFEEFRRGAGVIGDFATGSYEASILKGDHKIAVEMCRRGRVSDLSGEIRKTVVLSSDHPNELLIQYQVSGFPPEVPLHLAVELNFSSMPGGQSDRYFYDGSGQRLGTLDACLTLEDSDRLSLVDEWLGLDVGIETSRPAGFWTMPIETISQSEGGFEAVHQSVCVIPHWEFMMPESGSWTVDLRLTIDTSVAAARRLAESAVRALPVIPVTAGT